MWIEPKTDWTEEDSFNYTDYNRIKNNLEYLHSQVAEEWGDFEIEGMGADLEGYEALYDAKYFNAFEFNVDLINQNMFSKNYGFKKTFFYNGVFITWDELNRIEGAILSMKRIVDGKKSGKIHLAFRLGATKGLYV